jgi:hypothetical protein
MLDRKYMAAKYPLSHKNVNTPLSTTNQKSFFSSLIFNEILKPIQSDSPAIPPESLFLGGVFMIF